MSILEKAVVSGLEFEHIEEDNSVGIYESLYVEFKLLLPSNEVDIPFIEKEIKDLSSATVQFIKAKVFTIIKSNIHNDEVSKYVWVLDYEHETDSHREVLMSDDAILERIDFEGILAEVHGDTLVITVEAYC
jgi:hypothetical protein